MIKERNRLIVPCWRSPATALGQAMPVQRSSARSKSLTVFLATYFLLITSGCYSTMSMSKVPPESNALSPAHIQQRLAPAYLTSIQVSLNGARQNAAPTFESRIVGTLQEAALFSDVISVLGRERRPPNEVHFDLTLHVDEVQHPHSFGNGAKGFFVGLSLFLLTPALPFEYEHEATMTLSVTSPAGTAKEYVAHAQGSTHYTRDQAQKAIQKLVGQVVENCIVSLANQVAHDRTLQASMQQ